MLTSEALELVGFQRIKHHQPEWGRVLSFYSGVGAAGEEPTRFYARLDG